MSQDVAVGTETPAVRTLAGFLRLVEIEAVDCQRYPTLVEQLRTGAVHAIVIHQVYPEATLRRVVARLESHDPPFQQTWFPEAFRSFFYGRNLNLDEPSLPHYFADAHSFHQQLNELFAPDKSPQQHVADLIGQLDQSRAFRAAPGPNADDSYMFTTIRGHLEGGFIPAHCDNEQSLRPSYQHLATLVEGHIMSFVLSLGAPLQGGELQVYNHLYSPQATAAMNDDRTGLDVDPESLPSVRFRLPAGTMILVDSGRYLHRVTPVGGVKKRWAMCSFFARSVDHQQLYCWG
ncbi:MAG: 2OG-Fe(II) oxygenase [Planctomycetales bacterium]|nr:2OG-Fe(II) oxygenase [Planctomycetales bacterium]